MFLKVWDNSLPITQNFDRVLLTLIIFLIPIFKAIIPLLIGLLLLNTIIGFINGPKNDRNKFSFVQLSLALFFILHLLGLLYTKQENLNNGLFDVEIKLSFILIPLYFFLRPNSWRLDGKRLLETFFIAVLVSGIFHFLRMIIFPEETRYYYDKFFGFFFTKPFHLGYYALYLNFGFLLLLTKLKTYKELSLLAKLGVVLVALIISFFIYLTSSKIGIVSCFLLVSIFPAFYIGFKNFGLKNYLLVGFSLMVLLGILFAYPDSYALRRFKNVVIQAQENLFKEDNKTSTATRIFALKGAISLIKENPLVGVGTGDYEEETKKMYLDKGYIAAFDRKLNAHNQFLQTFATLGLFGFVSISLVFLSLFFTAVKQKNKLLIGFTAICLVFGLTESMFETQAGIVFFTFFSLILSHNNSEYDSIFTS